MNPETIVALEKIKAANIAVNDVLVKHTDELNRIAEMPPLVNVLGGLREIQDMINDKFVALEAKIKSLDKS